MLVEQRRGRWSRRVTSSPVGVEEPQRRARQRQPRRASGARRRRAGPGWRSGPTRRPRRACAPCRPARRPRPAGPAAARRRQSANGALDDLDDPVAVGDPFAVGGHPARRRGRARSASQNRRHSPSLPTRDLHGAVAAVEQAVRRDRGVVVALRPADLVRPRSTGCPGTRARRPRQPAARCGPPCRRRCGPARAARRARRTRRTCPASRSAIGTPDPLRVVGPGPGQRHQPGLALRDLVVAGPAALRAVVPEAGDREHDQPRVALHAATRCRGRAARARRCGSSPPARRPGRRAAAACPGRPRASGRARSTPCCGWRTGSTSTAGPRARRRTAGPSPGCRRRARAPRP